MTNTSVIPIEQNHLNVNTMIVKNLLFATVFTTNVLIMNQGIVNSIGMVNTINPSIEDKSKVDKGSFKLSNGQDVVIAPIQPVITSKGNRISDLGIAYTDINKVTTSTLWSGLSMEAIRMHSNESHSLLNSGKELLGTNEFVGSLILPPLEIDEQYIEIDTTLTENFIQPLSFQNELITSVDFCGELPLPPLD